MKKYLIFIVAILFSALAYGQRPYGEAFRFEPLTTAQMNGLPASTGWTIFNSDTDTKWVYYNGQWNDTGVGGGTDDQIASEVPFTPYGFISGTNVQTAIEDLVDNGNAFSLSGDPNPTLGADLNLGGFDVPVSPAVQAALDAQDGASEISFSPYNTITSTNVQAAVEELKDEVDAGLGDGLGPDGSVGDATVGLSGTTLTINADAIDSGKIADNAVISSKIPAEAITEVKIDAGNTPTDGQVLTWNTTTGRFEWVTAAGGGSAIAVFDEGIQIGSNANKFDFIGNGVTVTEPVAEQFDITITDDQTATEVAYTPYLTVTSTDVQAAINELKDELDAGGGADGNDFVTAGTLTGTNLTLTVPNQTDPVIDLSALDDSGTDDQTATEVPYTPYLTLGSTNTQAAINELKDELDAGGGADGVVTNAVLSGSTMNFTGVNGGFNGSVDLSTLIWGSAAETNLDMSFFDIIDIDNLQAQSATIGQTDIDDLGTINVNGGKITGGGLGAEIELTAGNDLILDLQGGGNVSLSGTGNFLDNGVPLTGDQDAVDVPVSPAVNALTNVQAVLEDHETRIDGLAGGGSDGVVTNVALNTNSLDFTGTGGGFNGSIDLSGYLDNTDAQDLTLTGNTLAVTGDPNTDVDLSGYLDNTDAQTLSLTGTDLTISGGNTQDLSSLVGGDETRVLTQAEFDLLSPTGVGGQDDGIIVVVDDATESIPAGNIEVSPAVNLLTDVQSVLEDHETRIDGLAGGGADGVVTSVALNTNSLDFTGTGGGFNGSVDLSSLDNTGEFVNLTTTQTVAGQKTFSNRIISNDDLTSNGSTVLNAVADPVGDNLTFNGRLSDGFAQIYIDYNGNGGGFSNLRMSQSDITYNGTSLLGGGGSDDQIASEVPFTPYLTIAATDVQAAIQELLDESSSGWVGTATSNLDMATFDITNVDNLSINSSPTQGILFDGGSSNGLIGNRLSASAPRMTFYPNRSVGTDFFELLIDDITSDFVFEIQSANDVVFRSYDSPLYLETANGDFDVFIRQNSITRLTATSVGVDINGTLSTNSTIDGRDVAADGTKLDGIESGATADQNASEVSVSAITNLTATDVQAALAEHQVDIDGLAAGGSDGVVTNATFSGNSIDFTGTGGGFNGFVDLNTISIATSNIVNGTIVEADLNISNSPADNQILSYNQAGSNFTWVNATGDGLGSDGAAGDITIANGGTTASINSGVIGQTQIATSGVASAEILNGSVTEVDLNITNTPSDNQILSYNAGGSNFTWVDDQTGGSSQTLSFTSPNLSISGGNSVDLSAIDTNTQLSNAQVEDIAGGMVSGNTETGITVTYQLGDNTIDFAVNGITQSMLNNNIVDSGKIIDGTIQNADLDDDVIDEAKLNVGNPPTDNYLLSYNEGNQNFTWVAPPSGGSGDITGVTAGNGLIGGGTTGAVTLNIDTDLRQTGNVNSYIGNTQDYILFDVTQGQRFYTASAEEMRLENDGDLHVDGDVIAFSTTVSDQRLKDNKKEIENATEIVGELKGYRYDWNNGSRKGQRDIGVIAQEVDKVLPEIVREVEMPLMDGETYKSVDYEKLTAVLIQAFNEQTERIEKLEKEVERLKKKK